MSRLKLFCIPYAGGSATFYNKWIKYLDEFIDLYPVEFPGRGIKCRDSLCYSMDELVNYIYKQVEGELDNSEYAIFGHSMGALVAYELAHKIKNSGYEGPKHIFFSGRQEPDILERNGLSSLSEIEFKDAISGYIEAPEELFENIELLDFFLPIFKSDFSIIENYRHVNKNDKLDCFITVLNGKQDPYVNINNVLGWSKYTKKQCGFQTFEGGHFYINDNLEKVVKIINDSILNDICLA